MKRILVITNNLNQASFRLRIAALIEPLAKRGLLLDPRLRPRGLWARRKLLRSAAEFDAVILQRKLLTPSETRLLARHARQLYYDVDDAVMYGLADTNRLTRWRLWRGFLATAANADHVVAGSEHLAAIFRKHGAKASVLPTVVDIAHYTAKQHKPATAPTLVWIGSRSTLPYLQSIAPALTEAARKVPGLKLVIIADQSWTDAPLPTELIPWSVQTEAAALCQGDIGIAPMPRDQWTDGKCGFKIVQYMAAGLPVIASPVGSNADLIVDGQTGLLCQSAQDWPSAIAALSQDADRRAAMGAAGRARAEQLYSLDRAVDFWEALLQEA